MNTLTQKSASTWLGRGPSTLLGTCFAAALFLISGAAAAAEASAAAGAANVLLLTGRGTATSDDGTIRILIRGDEVFPGELISTGSNSYLNLKFRDGAYILLRPNSRFQIEEYKFEGPTPVEKDTGEPEDEESTSAGAAVAAAKPGAGKPVPSKPVPSKVEGVEGAEAPKPSPAKPAPSAVAPPPAPKPAAPAPMVTASSEQASGSTRAFFRLLRGGFRAVSGLIGKANVNDYRVSTPVATIGIRGTDWALYIVNPVLSKDPVLMAAVPKGSADGGIVVGVITGGVFIANQAGKQTDVSAGHYSLTLPDGKTVTLPFDPQFVRVDPIPNPKTICK